MNTSIKKILIIIPFILIGVVLLTSKSIYIIDDAFITFRYAHNLLLGHGLSWNINGEPTQGYTNFLFVLLMYIGYLLNISPIKFSFVMNFIGLLAICGSVFQLLKIYDVRKSIRILSVITIAIYPATVKNLNSGLETLFWTGLIFVAFLIQQKMSSKKSTVMLYLLLFFATLTRPETVIFVFFWTFLSIINKQKSSLLLGLVLYLIFITGFLVFNKIYFGYVIPNSALVKINHPFQFPGTEYLVDVYLQNQLLFYATISLVTLSLIYGLQKRPLFNFLPFFIFIPFFWMTNPYMGMYGRYLYPLIVSFIVIIAIYTNLLLVKISQDPLSQSQLLTTQTNSKLFHIFSFIPLLVILLVSIKFIYLDLKYPFKQVLLNKEISIGRELGKEDYVDKILFAFGDAGSIPFYSRVNFLDVVGLNNNTIALNGSAKGGGWVVEYILSQNPDIIGFYSEKNGSVFNQGHGEIGTHYSELYLKIIDNNKYTYMGGFDCDWIVINFFVNNRSPFLDEIKEFFSKMSDIEYYQLTP